jgi:integrase
LARSTNRLTARGVTTMKEPGHHADGNGLYLKVTLSGSKSWTLIYRYGGKRRELGLGPLPPVTLAEARSAAVNSKALVREGIDPMLARRPAQISCANTFGSVATALIDGLEAGWRNAKHRAQWRTTLATYAASIWGKDVAAVDANDLIAILRPIWSSKPETASRVRGRIERVLDAAKVRGLRSGDNPAIWRGNLALLLPARKTKGQSRHHPAMPYADLPAFMVRLSARPAMAARALEFTILAAARTGETLGATWSELDLAAAIWTVPADRMKAGKVHRVPLPAAAVALLTKLATENGAVPHAHVFLGTTPGRPLSNMSMLMLLRRMQIVGPTPHGMRSAFRDWAGEETEFPREVAEAALAHTIGSEVERAYRRGDALAKRREMMMAWAEFLCGKAEF